MIFFSKELAEIIIHIAIFDFPDKWSNLLENIINKLNSTNDFREVYGCLLALYALFKNSKGMWTDKERLAGLVVNTFGLLEAFTEKLLDDYGLQAATAMHIILKIYFTSIYVRS